MPRIPRFDVPGARFHVMNRAIARRPLFETARDARFFQAQLARVVRDGHLEIHAFCLMTTHFHLLVTSPCARLAEAMRSVQLAYSRWFNRGRLRDGPLFRGRFRSARVRSQAHWTAALAYIDRNPVDARIVVAPSQYRHGSAALHVRPRGPLWLARSSVDEAVAERGGATGKGSDAYDRAILGWTSADARAEVIERRLREAPPDEDDASEDPLDDLVRASCPRVQAWMVHKAGLADATAPGLSILSSTTVLAEIERRCARSPIVSVRLTERARPTREVLQAGLLRTVSGLRYEEIAARTDCGRSAAHRRAREHVAAVGRMPDYARLAAEIVTGALAIDFPAPTSRLAVPRRVPALETGMLAGG